MNFSTFAMYFIFWFLGLGTVYIAARLCCRAWARTVAEIEAKRLTEFDRNRKRKDRINGS